ncbi:MAG: hypothetical protein G8237_06235 [Magnetococcales bacterium]|nr:hypothetical protein [Magnetococcales bacterium]
MMLRRTHRSWLWLIGVGSSLVGSAMAAVESPEAGAPQLGRLFTTPQIRSQLEQVRREVRKPVAPVSDTLEGVLRNTPFTEVKEPKGPRYLTVGGLLLKESGASLVWLNKKQYETAHGHEGENFQLEPTDDPANGVAIRLPNDANLYLLLPGQTLDIKSKQIRPSHLIPEPERSQARLGEDEEKKKEKEKEGKEKEGKEKEGKEKEKESPTPKKEPASAP